MTSPKSKKAVKGCPSSFRHRKPSPATVAPNGYVKLIPKPCGKSGSASGYNLKNAMKMQDDSPKFNRAINLIHSLATKHLDTTKTITHQNSSNLAAVFVDASEHPDGVLFHRYTDAWPIRAILQKYLLGTSARARKGIHASDRVHACGAGPLLNIDKENGTDVGITLCVGIDEGGDEKATDGEDQEKFKNAQQAAIFPIMHPPLSTSVDKSPNSSNNISPTLKKPWFSLHVQGPEMPKNGIKPHSIVQLSDLPDDEPARLKTSGENHPRSLDPISSGSSSSKPAPFDPNRSRSAPISLLAVAPDKLEVGQLFCIDPVSKEGPQNYHLPSKCPISECLDLVPRAPSLRLVEMFEDMVESDHSNRGRFEMNICQRIKYENDRIVFVGKAARKNWRSEFNWFDVANRVIRSQGDLWDVMLNEDVKRSSPFWIQLRGKHSLEELASKPELSLAATNQISAGYYGPKGMQVVKSTILRLFSAIPVPRDCLEPLGLSLFIELVLVPHTIAVLIAHDLHISVWEAYRVMSDSASIGIALQSIETEYNDHNLDLILKHNRLIIGRYNNDRLERELVDVPAEVGWENDKDTVPVRARKRRRLASPSS